MDPTPPNPTPTPPSEAPGPVPSPEAAEPVVELVRTNRENLGYALAFVAVLFLAAGIYFVMKGQRTSSSADAAKTEKDKDKDLDPEDPFKPLTLDSTETTQAKRTDYFVAGVACGFGMLLFGAAGAFLLAYPPKPTEREQRTEARVTILALGGLLGAFLMLTGALFFYLWSESLIKWLDKGEAKEARWVLIPLLMVLGGGALMFLSIWPARAEERNNTAIRRMVYGSNFGLTTLLLFVVLVIANVIFVMRVPNKLDTTSTGFYSLSPQTQQLLESLEQPIHAYAIFQEGGSQVTDDIRRLLLSCQDANPSRFRVTFLSPALNRKEITELKNEYPLAEMSREGVLLVAGEEGGTERKRHSFLRDDEFGDMKTEPDGRQTPVFNGEPKLLRELMFLAENKQKPKIYFTQSSGELALGQGGRGDSKRTAGMLRSYLEKNYFDVAELTFPPAGAPAKVPDDAAVVVVADPAVPLPPNGVAAIQKFMTEPRPDGKKGKLVVLAGAQPGPDRRPLNLGLDPVLSSFGVKLSDRFMYNVPTERSDARDRDMGTRITLATITQESLDARNPVALGFSNKVDRLPLLDCREVAAAPGGPGGFQTVTVLESMRGRPTWTEAEYAPSPVEAWRQVTERVKAITNGPGTDAEKEKRLGAIEQELQLTRRPRPLAVFVSEGGMGGADRTARVAVFGCGWFVSDDASGQAARGQVATLWLDLMGSTLDWVRDRPTVGGVTEKPYTTYTLKPGYDGLRMKWVPLGVAFLIVFGLGAGVWVIRRK